MKIFVLLGAPGSGKGTIASRLVDRFQASHISSGDLLREAVKNDNTPATHIAAEAMLKGELVPDEIVDALVLEYLHQCPPDQVIFLDGYPRNETQAATLIREGIKVDAAISFDVPQEVLLARLAGRRICSRCAAGYHIENIKPRVDGICDRCGGKLVQRADDQPERIANRLVVYHSQNAALVAWYEERGLLRHVDANGSVAEVVERVAEVVAG